jgi:hypothetical protein
VEDRTDATQSHRRDRDADVSDRRGLVPAGAVLAPTAEAADVATMK